MSEANELISIVGNVDSSSQRIPPQTSSKLGLYLVGVTGGIATAISVICVPFVSPAFRKICLPYVPATTRQVHNVLKALEGRSGSLIDLGSGDGRVVFATAKAGFEAYGVELNPWLVWYSRLKALITGSSSRTRFVNQNLWKHDLRRYDNVVLFGVDQMMHDVENKFEEELRDNSVVVACRFPLPTMNSIRTVGEGVDAVWVYKISKS